MKKVLQVFEEIIADVEKSIQASKDFETCSGCYITDSSWDQIMHQMYKLNKNKEKLSELKSLPECKCSNLRKVWTPFKKIYSNYFNINIYQCKKCNNYYS